MSSNTILRSCMSDPKGWLSDAYCSLRLCLIMIIPISGEVLAFNTIRTPLTIMSIGRMNSDRVYSYFKRMAEGVNLFASYLSESELREKIKVYTNHREPGGSDRIVMELKAIPMCYRPT